MRGERSLQAPAMLPMLNYCRRSVAAARRALAGRVVPSGLSSDLPLLASRRGAHGRPWLSVAAAATPLGQPGDGRRGAAASPAAVAAHPAHSPSQQQQQLGAQQPDLPHLRQLSEEQLAAVTAPLGTIRVVAGPGSGKVRMLHWLWRSCLARASATACFSAARGAAPSVPRHRTPRCCAAHNTHATPLGRRRAC